MVWCVCSCRTVYISATVLVLEDVSRVFAGRARFSIYQHMGPCIGLCFQPHILVWNYMRERGVELRVFACVGR